MKLTVIGTGYVGLVTGTCLAETGNDVTCVDNDRQKDRPALRRAISRSTSRGWPSWSARNVEAGRLRFTADLAAATPPAKLVFLAVGTPPADDGSVDLAALWAVVAQIAPHLAARRRRRHQEHGAGGDQCGGRRPAAQADRPRLRRGQQSRSFSRKGRPSTIS